MSMTAKSGNDPILGTWNLEMAVVTLVNTAGGAMEAALKLGTRVCSPEYQGTRPPCDISG